jgi:hypothetical protein
MKYLMQPLQEIIYFGITFLSDSPFRPVFLPIRKGFFAITHFYWECSSYMWQNDIGGKRLHQGICLWRQNTDEREEPFCEWGPYMQSQDETVNNIGQWVLAVCI